MWVLIIVFKGPSCWMWGVLCCSLKVLFNARVWTDFCLCLFCFLGSCLVGASFALRLCIFSS